MKNLCIIPARGGSKRIPRKNIRPFLGKPIIAYSIETALESGLFDEVMVSTDDDEIAKIAAEHGAKVPFLRSEENSDDHASTYDVIEEVLNEYKKEGSAFKSVCCIYPCAPFVTTERLKEGCQLLIDEQLDSVFPIMEFSYPIQRAIRVQNGKVELFTPSYINYRSQDIEKSYHDAGQFYWINTANMLRKKGILTDNCRGIVITEIEGQDIDNEMDWKLAELKFKLFRG